MAAPAGGDSLDYARFDRLAEECASDDEPQPETEEQGAAAAGTGAGTGASPPSAAAPSGGLMELDNMDLPPLFWDSIPENADEHDDMAAINAILEEDTPEERAEALKNQGNDRLRFAQKTKQKLYFREAEGLYCQALAVQCSDPKMNALIYSNRAQVNLLLENNARALADALGAIKLDNTSTKSYYRAAQAALRTGKWQQCERLCQDGLKLDPTAKELSTIQKKALEHRAREQEAEQNRMRKERAAKAAAMPLAMTMAGRGWRIGRPQFSVGTNSRPSLDEEGLIHWPVVMMYPEVMSSDSIEDFHEGTPISAQLDMMFGAEAPPLAWDDKNDYRRDTVELYYLAHCGRALTEDQLVEVFMGHSPSDFVEEGPARYGTKAATWVRVEEEDALGEVLQRPDFVVPGVPVFFVVAKDTEFRRKFLANETKILK